MNENLERFLRYVQIDTQSDDTSTSVPSTAKQLNLTRLLEKELKTWGVECYINSFGILYGKLPGEEGLDPIGFDAHVDTALELPGCHVRPQLIENYDGGVIQLNETYAMSPADFPSLGEHVGDTLVVTSGDTLLGADDKAGVAEIMGLIAYYVQHPEERHHPICFCFSPDEEIGHGSAHFDPVAFGAKYAYTVDGGYSREIACATFNAAHADVVIHGVSIHPGEAKGKMFNASSLAFEFDRLLPALQRPEYTDGWEGFNHLIHMEGACDIARMHYIIRNHDAAKFEEQKEGFRSAIEKMRRAYPKCSFELSIVEDYRNMQEVLDKFPAAKEKAAAAFRSLGVEPLFPPIRGGTDGAGFSFMGCPTPNLGTGSYNHHGRYEYLSVREFDFMIEVLKAIVRP